MTAHSLDISRGRYGFALFLLAAAALAVAIMPNGTKLGLQSGANAQALLIIRTFIGIVVFGAMLLARHGSFRVPREVLWLLLAAGITSALMNFTFVNALITIDVSLAVLIMFIHPFFVVWWFNWESGARMTAQQMLWSLMAFVGLALALAVDVAVLDVTGLLYALVAMLLCTVMVVCMVKAHRKLDGVTVCFHISLVGFAMFAGIALVTGSLAWPGTALGWTGAVGAGLAFTVAYFAWLIAAGIIGAGRASMLSFIEPVATILVAALLFGERLTLLQWGGVALVAAGLLLLEAAPGKRPKHA